MRPVIACALMLALAGCSSGQQATPPDEDSGFTLLEASVDGQPPPADGALPDGGPADQGAADGPAADGPSPDAGCVLGTPDNCSYCGHVCPPGKDTASTARVCLAGTCGIQCKDENYDVNGQTKDGCEAQDDLPVHPGKTEARNLGKLSDCDNTKSYKARIPSDARNHLKAPTSRPNGRPDWFKVHIDDKFGCVVNSDVTLILQGLPAASSYTATAFWVCDKDSKQLATVTKSGKGGATLSLDPSTGCTTLGDDSGTLYVSLTKTSGTHSNATYTLQVEP